MTHQSLYRLELWNREYGRVADLSALTTNRSFVISLNRAESLDLTFSLPVIEEYAHRLGMTPQRLLAPGINDIRVWRANKPIFGATIRYIKPEVTASEERLELHASGYLDDLSYRYLWPVEGADGGVTRYEDMQIADIIMTMINTTQNRAYGSLGITEGNLQPSRPLTDTWQPFATSLRDIIISITERRNSVDVSFTHDRKLNVYYPQQGRRQTDLLFSYPGNISSMSTPSDASQLINVSINRGSGNGLDITPIETRQDIDSLTTYGRMEQIDDYADVSVPETLQAFGDETLRSFSQPLIIPDVVLKPGEDPPLGAYWVGDTVRFSIPNRPAFQHVSGREWRIHEISVVLNDLDTEEITLTVARQ